MDLFKSSRFGLKKLSSEMPLADGFVRLVYYTNLIWDGTTLTDYSKPFPRHSLHDFSDYFNFMRDSLKRIGNNLTDAGRSTPYTWLGTISRGYDSPTCAALAKYAGLQRVLTFNESRPGVADDGHDIARSLGLDCVVLDRLGWHRNDLIEPAFLVADGQGKEVSMAAAAGLLDNTVLLTGFGGDYVWNRNPYPINEDLHRGDYSGLSLSEYRLHRGFIHLPLPYLAMRQVSDIARISQSDEMIPWDTQGPYTRPICRRIVEEAGVSRNQFGVKKTGNSVRFLISQDAWSKSGKRAFLNWLWAKRKETGLSCLGWVLGRSAQLIIGPIISGKEQRPWPVNRIFHRIYTRVVAIVRRYGFEDMPFVWAVECIRKKYKRL